LQSELAHQDNGWGGYVVDDLALAHDAGVTDKTEDSHVAYAKRAATPVHLVP